MNVRKVTTKKQETMAIVRIEDLHGGIDAIVFPRTYAVTSEIWREDAIVVVQGKIDVRRADAQSDEEGRGTPEILIDSAEEWLRENETEELPPLLDEPTPVMADWADADASSDVADLVAETSTPYVADYVESPEATIAASEIPTASTGHEAQPIGPRHITLLFQESGDQQRDLQRLQQLHAVLTSAPGDDPYTIAFYASGGRKRLEGDRLRVHFSEQIEQEVAAILGGNAVRVDR
jgi:DNA polymerase-3 subunit alpha